MTIEQTTMGEALQRAGITTSETRLRNYAVKVVRSGGGIEDLLRHFGDDLEAAFALIESSEYMTRQFMAVAGYYLRAIEATERRAGGGRERSSDAQSSITSAGPTGRAAGHIAGTGNGHVLSTRRSPGHPEPVDRAALRASSEPVRRALMEVWRFGTGEVAGQCTYARIRNIEKKGTRDAVICRMLLRSAAWHPGIDTMTVAEWADEATLARAIEAGETAAREIANAD